MLTLQIPPVSGLSNQGPVACHDPKTARAFDWSAPSHDPEIDRFCVKARGFASGSRTGQFEEFF